jgi:hypothetical protein
MFWCLRTGSLRSATRNLRVIFSTRLSGPGSLLVLLVQDGWLTVGDL